MSTYSYRRPVKQSKRRAKWVYAHLAGGEVDRDARWHGYDDDEGVGAGAGVGVGVGAVVDADVDADEDADADYGGGAAAAGCEKKAEVTRLTILHIDQQLVGTVIINTQVRPC